MKKWREKYKEEKEESKENGMKWKDLSKEEWGKGEDKVELRKDGDYENDDKRVEEKKGVKLKKEV